MSARIELEGSACQQISQSLAKTLSDTYILYIKTQNFHWNVIDPRFYFLHKMLEAQYEELAEEIDELAERIRMLGEKSPGSMQEFLEIGSLTEAEGDLSANQMIEQLLNDHEKIASNLRARIQEATDLGDQGTADLFIKQLRSHEKEAWTLRSHFYKDTL